MNDIDDRIRAALGLPESATSAEDTRSVYQDIKDDFEGRYRMLIVLGWSKLFLCYLLIFSFVYQFFQQDADRMP